MSEIKTNTNLGLYCLAAGLSFYIFVILKIIINLPIKIDTLLLFSWPILPGIIGSYIFYRMDNSGTWRNNK